MIQKFLLLILVAIVGVCMFIVTCWKFIVFVVFACIVIVSISIHFRKKGDVSGDVHGCVKKLFDPKSDHVNHKQCNINTSEKINISTASACSNFIYNSEDNDFCITEKCMCKRVAVKNCCENFIEVDARCRLEKIMDCNFVRDAFIQRHECGEAKIKPCRWIAQAKNNGCDFFEYISEQCMLKNEYLGCRWGCFVPSYSPYRPVAVRTYVKKNGTVVYSHVRSRRGR